jgi:predicted phage terminase large subunit-like protein
MKNLQGLTQREIDAALRLDLSLFAERSFLQLQPGTPFLPNWHIELMAAKLRDCALGKIRRLIINIPPRYMKSLTASVAFPAWLLGIDPTAQIVAVSYAQELANKHSLDCRAVIESDWYRRLFPATRLSASKNAVTEYATTKRGFRMATSVGGTLTGRGGEYIIIDDPIKPDDAASESVRTRGNDWFDGVLYTRQNNKNTSCIIIVMHRLHEDDLVGHVLEQEEWEVLSLPAIAEEDQAFTVDTPWGEQTFTRSTGGILHPAFESEEALKNTRATIGEYNFAGQYQQSPAPLGGGMVKKEWLKYYKPGALPKFDQIIVSCDTGNKPTELADYSAITVWGYFDPNMYLLHVYRAKIDYPNLKRALIDIAARYHADVVLIEEKASGIQLLQELREAQVRGVKGYEPKGDKAMRLYAQCATIENGGLWLPAEAPWLPEYVHELTTFPGSKHDDMVDATSQVLEWLKIGQKGMGLFYFYKRLYGDTAARQRGDLPPLSST